MPPDPIAPAGGGTPGLTEEAINKLLDDKLNRLVGNRLNRESLGKLLDEKFKTAMSGEAISKAVEEAIVKMVAATPAEPATPPSGKTPQQGNAAPQGNADPKDDPKYRELQQQIKALQDQHAATAKQLATEREAAKKSAADAKQARIHGHIEQALLPHSGNNAKLARLIAKELAATVDEIDGGYAWKRGEEDPQPFADGLKAWLATPEAKELLPAQHRNIPLANFHGTPSGYGERGGQGNAPQRNPLLDEMRRGLNTYAPDPTGTAPSSQNR